MKSQLPRRSVAVVLSAAAVAAGVLGFTLRGGPLNPPAGAVSGTNKTLAELEPRIAINSTNTPGNISNIFRIAQPGSYYLTGNVTGEANKNGILIEVGDVTIDLNGYTLTGVAGSANGIASNVGANGVRILNGTVKSWGLRGISVSNTNGGIIDNVRSISNGTSSAQIGLLAGPDFIVSDCVASGNSGSGISAGNNSVLVRCVASGNVLVGIGSNSSAHIIDCTSRLNGSSGFAPGSGSLVRGCVASDNGTHGIDGVNSLLIENCGLYSNTGVAIKVTSFCTIRNNTCDGNSMGAGGIQVNSACLVEGNCCRNTTTGVQATALDNVIVSNHFSGHTSAYVLPAGNHFGPFVVSGSNGASVSGNAAQAGTLGSTDPRANFID